jgi:soluble lytic murein transglycosylase-like protein
MRAESAGDAHAISPKGAMGPMQIMPGTWADLRARYHLGADPFDAHDNILAGAAYLRELRDRYGAPGFLAAYQAGPRRYEDHLTTGRALPADTLAYVAALAPVIGGASDDSQVAAADPLAWTRAPLFTASHASVPAVASSPAQPQPDRGGSDHATVEVSELAPQSDGLFAPISGRRP